MENFILLCMPVCGIYILVHTCRTSITQECTEDLQTRLKKEMVVLENKVMEVTKLVLRMKKMTADMKSNGKNTGYTHDHTDNSCQAKVAGVIL